eukprot:2103218-Alexandrium_andersonii.AAC.1
MDVITQQLSAEDKHSLAMTGNIASWPSVLKATARTLAGPASSRAALSNPRSIHATPGND